MSISSIQLQICKFLLFGEHQERGVQARKQKRYKLTTPAVVPEVRAGGGGKEAVVGTVKVDLVGRLADEPDPALVAAAALVAPRPHVVHAQGHAVAHLIRKL